MSRGATSKASVYHLALLTTLSGMTVRRVVAAIAALVLLAACGADPVPTAVTDAAKACATYKASNDAVNAASDAWYAEGKPSSSPNRTALRKAWAAQPSDMALALTLARGTDVQDEMSLVVRVVAQVHGIQDAGRTVTKADTDLLAAAWFAADGACDRVGK